MWNSVLCLILAILPGCVYAGLAEEMAETTQLCCGQGTRYARNHTSDECSSSVPPDVSPTFGSLCIFAMDQCCKEYFQKKESCDSGSEVANTGKCDSAKDFSKSCCKECLRGKAAGGTLGEAACVSNVQENSPEELLTGDAYVTCCKKAAAEGPPEDHSEEPAIVSTKKSILPSLCEDYAPNELCAHHCIPVPGSYKCECNTGFKLMADGRNCIEVVKNRCKPHNPCQHKCNDNGIEVKCSCRRGYELMADGKSCKDIDECNLDPPVCLSDTKCNNIQGSYRCIPIKRSRSPEKGQCPPGFARNLQNNACDDINECALPHPPCPAYICENTVGGYKCGGVPGDPVNLATSPKTPSEERCPPGFRTGYDEQCEDVDECAMNNDDCNHQSQFCINTRGSFYCQDKASKHCPPGFKIDPKTNKCEDIDECEESDEICRSDQICINHLGQYDCVLKSSFSKRHECPDGMRLKQRSSVCEDIDECVEGTHLCDQYQNCLNTNGSHECYCKIGFELDATTGACVDINECATEQNSCIRETQRCDNTIGSFLCIRFTSCGTGYILHHSTGKCEDIDECALGVHNCARAGSEYHCVNMPGSFRCVRKRTTSTTTTTPQLEYEYYYDSEEEIETNETSPKTENEAKPSTTTTPKAETSSEAQQTIPTTKPTEPPPPLQVYPTQPEIFPSLPEIANRFAEIPPGVKEYDENNEIIPPSTNEPYIPDAPIEPTTPEQQPITPTEVQRKAEEKDSKVTPNPPEQEKPYYYEPRSTEPSRYEPPSINESIPPEPIEPEQPETTYASVSPTVPPVATRPSLVYVEVGKETATVKAEKANDGSVVINTKDVPLDEWTKVNEKPTNCQVGFELGEYGACYDIDECVTNRHKCSGLTELCRNTMGGYLCDCAPGFRRDLYTRACDLIPTSTSTTTSTTTPPPPTTTRYYFWGYPETRPGTVRPFRPRTLCDAGFHLNSLTGICEDVNECVNGQANCMSVEICVNTEGGYKCECPPNWHLDLTKQRCVPNRTNDRFPTGYGNQPVYPPISPEYPGAGVKGTGYVDPEITAIENRGTVIKCPWGYRLGDDNTCVDIDECVTGDANCGPLQICTNLPGGYTCSCPAGHRLVRDHECEDVDECSLAGNNPICSRNADCVNTIGSYQCRCHEGFRSAPINDKVCVDIDECTENRAGSLCEQRCNNVWGSYRCSCHRGYRINPDNSTCSDIDECTEFKSKIPCVGKCHNQPGSYRCDCPSGYRLSEDKRSCIDIDECETGVAPCAGNNAWTGSGSHDVCLNTRGGYRCHRITCPPGYQLESKHRCTKVERECPPGDWECAHQPSTYSYNFITFVSNLYIPAAKVDLFTMRGPQWVHAKIRFQLKLLDVNAPPSVKNKANINSFLLSQTGNQGVVSLVHSLEGPQSIELELIMELYSREQFGGIAVAKLYIYVSEYEF